MFAVMESLEFRQLLTAAAPTPYEQYMLELLNRARLDPAAEAARLGITLNEGLPDGTISDAPKQPLAFNPQLIAAARNQSQWMLDTGLFQHDRPGGSTPETRMRDAGYSFVGPYTWGENIAWRGTTGTLDLTDAVRYMEEIQLFVNKQVDGRHHRLNLMDPDFREVGLGILTGNFDGFHAAMATQNFASSAASASVSFLTGVAYNDALVRRDDFYTPGEGLGGILITATRASDHAVFQTTTWASGGYTLALSPGAYTIVASGSTLGAMQFPDLVIGSQNVKLDFTAALTDLPAPLVVTGTSGNDLISTTVKNGVVTVLVNGSPITAQASRVSLLKIDAGGGNDLVSISASVGLPCSISGGSGNDSLYGGNGRDTLRGGDGNDLLRGGGGADILFGDAGSDTLWGGGGNDTLRGGLQNDLLYGDAQNDSLYGEGGNDRLRGSSGSDLLSGGDGNDSLAGDSGNDTLRGDAGSDTLDGGAGSDTLDGGSGDDRFYARDLTRDLLLGGDGNDLAQRDVLLDRLSSISRFF